MEWKGMPVFCGPRGLPYGNTTLFRNHGDGTFVNVSQSSGINERSGCYAFTSVAADRNRDGWTARYIPLAIETQPFLIGIDETIEKVSENGGEFIVPKMPVPGVGWLAYFKDPQGNVFGIMQSDKSAK